MSTRRKRIAALKEKETTSASKTETEVKEAKEKVNPDPVQVEKQEKIAVETESSAAQKIKSPLLSEPVEVKEHALGIGPGSGTPKPETFQVSGDFFSSPAQNGIKQPEPQPQPQSQVNTPPPVSQNPLPVNDAPEQVFSSVPSGSFPSSSSGPLDGNNIPVPDNIARQGASDLADTIMDIYKRLVPDVSHEMTKIATDDIRDIKKAEQEGHIMAGTHEELTAKNEEHKTKFKERAKEDAAMIKKPLKKLLEAKNIQAPPHIELIIVLIFVAATYFMLIREIKNSNKNLIDKIYGKIAKEKGVENPKQESDIPLMETEEIK